MREIKLNYYSTIKYIKLNIYILEYYNFNKRSIEVLLKYQTFIVNNLYTKILIRIDILILENINLVISIYLEYINSYYIKFKLIITPLLRLLIKQNILFKKSILILVKLYIVILITRNELLSNNYLFKLINKYLVILFITLIDFLFYVILIYNNLDQLVYLSSKLQFSLIINLKADDYYYLQNINKVYKLVIKLSK